MGNARQAIDAKSAFVFENRDGPDGDRFSVKVSRLGPSPLPVPITVVERHKKSGRPLVVWMNGKTVRISPNSIK